MEQRRTDAREGERTMSRAYKARPYWLVSHEHSAIDRGRAVPTTRHQCAYRGYFLTFERATTAPMMQGGDCLANGTSVPSRLTVRMGARLEVSGLTCVLTRLTGSGDALSVICRPGHRGGPVAPSRAVVT